MSRPYWCWIDGEFLEAHFELDICVTYEFLEKAPSDVLLRDGPFLYLIGKTMDAAYEIVDDDFLCCWVTAHRIKLIPKADT